VTAVSARSRVRGAIPRVPRSTDRIVAGVAGGWAQRWGVEPTVVRASIGLLSMAGGIGVALYGLAALNSVPPVAQPPVPTSRPRDVRRELAIACATAAVLVAARAIGLWPGDSVMLPASAVALGAAIFWTRVDDGKPAGGRALSRFTGRLVQVVGGIALVIAGVVSLASRTGGLTSIGVSAAAIAVVVGGLAIFAAPALGRLLRTLDEERAMRIRDEERAAVATHLHDSVLQSLVLMQRTDDPRRMASLARRQERELRAWLYGIAPAGDPASLHAAIEAMCVGIETDHDIRVEAVVVGDQLLDDAARALLAALREAVVNAARHADVDRVDVFVEVDDIELRGFVRDTGCGFDPTDVPDHRHGISDSIVGRVRRAGGTTAVTSSKGTGTEIEIIIPRITRSP
jgi:signal transduction histidine kinase/phage shock protein PspC (stress-responsive transcriptional regulator)